MRQYAAVLLLSVIPVLFNISCKNNPAEPVLPEPGRRDYVWTVDTLDIQQGESFVGMHIYGETPDDIWAVGFGTGAEDLWHYDGKKWKETALGIYKTNYILGFSKNDIWISGDTYFWHYNGSQWQRYPNVVPPGYANVSYMAMTGTGTKDIYAAGVSFEKDGHTPKSSVAHFDGTGWTLLDVKNIPVVNFIDIKLEKSTGKYYILSTTDGTIPELNRVHLFQGNSVKEIFSSSKPITINNMNGECYFASGDKIYKYRDDKMQLWKDLSGTNYLGFLWGRSEGDFFTMNNGALGHYNGRDMIDIFKTDLWVRSGLLFTDEVIFMCVNPYTSSSYVFYGKLK